mgnify:FL=1|tara:strand:+ start:1533 stop:2489 length:957 start_codon:yes stop_codon:yes gene_type:complete
MNKVIVTGGAGFIGSNLVKRLLDDGAEQILVIDDFSTGKKENLYDSTKITLIESKLEELDDLKSVFDGYDFCFHLAAGVGVQYIMDNLSDSLLTNIQGTHIVFEACKENDIPVLITSTSEIYGTSQEKSWDEETKSLIGPTTKLRWSYAVSKMIDEFLALSEFEAGNLKPIIVRLFNTIGPNQVSDYGMVVPRFVEAAINNKDIVIHGDGSQSRSFTWVGDVIEYFIRLAKLKTYGEIYNIGQTEEISIKELAELVINTTKSNSELTFLSHKDVFGDKFEDPKRRTPNIDKIIKATGYKPSYDIKTMIHEIVEFKRQD